MPLPMMFSPMSADLLADRMCFLSNPELMADTFEFNPPADFDARAWADAAQKLADDLKDGRAIELDDRNVTLLVESIEGNRLIWIAGKTKRAGLIQMAQVLAKRLEPYAGRPVRPELGVGVWNV